MQQEKITAIFDQQASSYDQRWSHTAPINHALHLFTRTILAELPANARILCVGAGTGGEILHLAQTFPDWHFTAVEPSTAMLAVLQRRAEQAGITDRCAFHSGYLDSLPASNSFDAATAFLVSQFIVDRRERTGFFRGIAARLGPTGTLVSSDLAGDLTAPDCRNLLEVWFRLTSGDDAAPDGVERLQETYRRDLSVLPPDEVRDIIAAGGFGSPVQFYQAGLIHAWYTKRRPIEQSG